LAYNINLNYKVKIIDLSDNTQVNSGGGTNTQTLKPAAGKIYEVFMIGATWPAIGGASGNHSVVTRLTDGTDTVNMLSITGTDGAVMSITGYYGCAGSSVLPNSIAYTLPMIRSLVVSNTKYIEFYYANNSDTNQTGTRELNVWVKEFNECG